MRKPQENLLRKRWTDLQAMEIGLLLWIRQGKKKAFLSYVAGTLVSPTPACRLSCDKVPLSLQLKGLKRAPCRDGSQVYLSGPTGPHPLRPGGEERLWEYPHYTGNKHSSSTTIKKILSSCKTVRPTQFLIIHSAFCLQSKEYPQS